jgi:hypothetical protein
MATVLSVLAYTGSSPSMCQVSCPFCIGDVVREDQSTSGAVWNIK